jgi:hypothetical protein
MFLDRDDLTLGIVQGDTQAGTKLYVAKEADLIYLKPGMAWSPTGQTKRDSHGTVFSEYTAVLIPASAVATPEAAAAAAQPSTALVITPSGQVAAAKKSYLPYIVGTIGVGLLIGAALTYRRS